jgi:drug/metabolite transporter (DMT)-like permease
MAVIGLLFCVIPFNLFAWAGESLASGLSAILNSSTPLMTALWTAALVPAERLARKQAIGVAIGGLGVVLVVGPWGLGGHPAFLGSLPAELACLGATGCYGLGFAYMRRFVVGRYDYDSLAVSTVQLTLAAAAALAVSPILAAGPLPALTPAALISIGVLGVFGTGIAYLSNTAIVRAWGAVAASTVTYVAPLVGIALGALVLVLGESLSWNQPLGCLVVIAGIIAVHRGRKGTTRPAVESTPSGPATTTSPNACPTVRV